MKKFLSGRCRGVTSLVGVLMMVVVALVVASTLTVLALSFGGALSGGAPVAQIDFQYDNFDDGVAKNDTVTVVHESGDRLERERLEVVVGDDVVFNETDDSESNDPTDIPGLRLEVDDDEFNDLNKPCRYKTGDCNLTESFSDPPGDSNGADPGVKLEWEETVTAGQRLTIQERNHENAYDVMDAGESITVVYRGDDFTAIVAEDTVAPEHAE